VAEDKASTATVVVLVNQSVRVCKCDRESTREDRQNNCVDKEGIQD
jgi:hypothetical protein